MRVDRPVRFEVTANPLQEPLARHSLGHFDSVMDANQANPFSHDLFKFFTMGMQVMPPASIAVNDDGIRVVEGGGISRPPVLIDLGDDRQFVLAGRLVQALGPSADSQRYARADPVHDLACQQ